MKRTLTLHREALTELDASALSAVAGAAAVATTPLRECLMTKVSPATCGGPPGSTHCPQPATG